jgi:hypothetical protein
MHILIHSAVGHLANFYNKIERYWEGDKNHRILGSFIVITFLLSLLLIFLNRLGLIHSWFAAYIPTKYFSAIVYAFMVLLVFEIFSMIFVLPGSVSGSMLKQFEIFSLILLRDVFKNIESFPEPVSWGHMTDSIIPMALDAAGALLIFIGIYYIRKMQLHRTITPDKKKQNQFREIKKILSLILIIVFTGLAAYDIVLFFRHSELFEMFTLFYTILIFFDILIVLISLRYNLSYRVLFRNSAFAIATIMLRFSLTAPAYYKAGLGVASVIFVLILTYFYSKYMIANEGRK